MRSLMWRATVGLLAATLPTAVFAVDWSAVPEYELTLFHPGQSSWQWLLTKHEGADKIRQGKDCLSCHAGEIRKMGESIVAGKGKGGDIEPETVKHEPAINATVQVARDADYLYVRLQWPKGHQTVEGYRDPEFASKATVMIGSPSLVEFQRGGCWAACHADAEGMPHQMGLSKYLVQSRTAITIKGGSDNYKPQPQLKELLAENSFLEYWQAAMTGGPPQATAKSGYVLDKRHLHPQSLIEASAAPGQGPQWVAVIKRPLNPDTDAPHLDLKTGKKYIMAFSLHTGHASGRFHHVSLKTTLDLGADQVSLEIPKPEAE